MKRINIGLLSLLIIVLFNACATKSVTRIDPEKQVDLSGRWNDVDSRKVAEEMTGDCLNRAWRNNFQNKFNKKPTIILGDIVNKSHEHIEASTFIKDMEKEFINSGSIRIVQNDQFREKMRMERADQQKFSSLDTQKKWGKELGADYMMFGTINSIVDQEGKRKVIFYQINLELADLESNEIVWIGDKKIKKYVVN
ncbi:MAG: penicillin-binding protein activator LpoB [Cytophagales bacterium]|nr:MAG: penicillin-binding protein activator LpoB [Cytophagales bacterium]